MKTKEIYEKASISTKSAENISPKEADDISIQEEIVERQVKIVGMNEYHKTLIIQPIGYKIGDSAKCPLIENPSFEFLVTGEEIQLVTY